MSCFTMFSQEALVELSFEVSLDELAIPEEDKQMVKARCQNLLQNYAKYSQFSSETFLFEFEQLFDTHFEVQLYNDLEFNAITRDLEMSDYLQVVELSFVPKGTMNVTIEDARVKSISVTQDGNYQVVVDLEKKVERKLDDKGVFKYSGSGFPNDLTLFIEIDPAEDDEVGAKIVKISGSSSQTKDIEKNQKVKSEKDVLLSFGFLGGIGTVSNGGSVLQTSYLGSSSLSSYGGFLQYRRSVSDKLYASVRIQSEFMKINTDIDGFNANNYPGFTSNGEIKAYFLEPDNFTSPEFDDVIVQTQLIPTSYDNANEKLNLLSIQTAIGVDYIVSEGFLISKFMVGLDLLVNYIQSSGDGTINGDFSGLNIPDTLNFPDQMALLEHFNADLPIEYNSSSNSSNQDIRPESHLSFGLGLNANKIIGITRKLGLEVGASIQYNFTSLLKNTDIKSGNDIVPTSGFVLDDAFANRNQSVLEDHFNKNSPLRASLKVGLILQL